MALSRKPTEIVEEGAHALLNKAPSWERVFLSEIADVQNGYPFESKFFTHGEGLPLIRIRDITENSTENFYLGSFEPEFIVNRGDILIGMDGDFTAARWEGPDGLLNQRVCRIFPNTALYSDKFLLLCLQPYLNAINAETSSVTVKHLSSRSVGEIPLPLPPLNEQRRIVAKIEELFSELDKGIENLKQARTQLAVYRQALLKHAFEGKLTADWRATRITRLESAAQLVASIGVERELGRSNINREEHLLPVRTQEGLHQLPEQWIWISVSDTGNIETGTTPPTNSPKLYGDKLPFFKPTDLEQGINVQIARDYLSEDGMSHARILPAGTTLVTCIGATIGKTGLARLECATNQQINSIIPVDSIVPEFIYYQAIGPNFQGQLKKNASSTTLPIINKSKFSRLPLALCSHLEQVEIVRILDEQSSAIAVQEADIDANLQKAEALRQSILKKAFAGELVPQDPADEPAAALLARLRAEREAVARNSKAKKPARARLKTR